MGMKNYLQTFNMDKTPQEQIDEINRKLDLFLVDYYRNNNPTSQIFTKKVFFQGGVDLSSSTVSLGATGGTVGLYGVTPVAKASAIGAPTAPSGAYAQAEAQSAVTAINSIRTALSNLGITA